jgi:hypothetical protein
MDLEAAAETVLEDTYMTLRQQWLLALKLALEVRAAQPEQVDELKEELGAGHEDERVPTLQRWSLAHAAAHAVCPVLVQAYYNTAHSSAFQAYYNTAHSSDEEKSEATDAGVVLAVIGDEGEGDRMDVLFQDGVRQNIPAAWVVPVGLWPHDDDAEEQDGSADDDDSLRAGGAKADGESLTAQIVAAANQLESVYRQKDQELQARRQEINALGERVRGVLTTLTLQTNHANAKAKRYASAQVAKVKADAEAEASQLEAATKQAARLAQQQARAEADQIVAAAREQAEAILLEAKQQAASVAEDRTAWEEEKAAIAATHTFSGGKITIDVGGTKFATRLATLQTGEAEDSMLGAMFSGRHPLEKEEDGSYFIDRDGRAFHDVLNYLRDPVEYEPPRAPGLRREVLKQADFYQLAGLVDQLSYDTVEFEHPLLASPTPGAKAHGRVLESATLPTGIFGHLKSRLRSRQPRILTMRQTQTAPPDTGPWVVRDLNPVSGSIDQHRGRVSFVSVQVGKQLQGNLVLELGPAIVANTTAVVQWTVDMSTPQRTNRRGFLVDESAASSSAGSLDEWDIHIQCRVWCKLDEAAGYTRVGDTPQVETQLVPKGPVQSLEIHCGTAPSASYVLSFSLGSVTRKAGSQPSDRCTFCGRNGYMVIEGTGRQCRSCRQVEPSADTLAVNLCVTALEMYGTVKVPIGTTGDDVAAVSPMSPHGARRGSGDGGGDRRSYGDDY